ncbi:glutathione S-transferase [Paraphoma chrysanthemicola]|nr:glutathione S-transferase [Paraphoma chrysanthemicola]
MSPKLHLYLSPGSCALASHIALQETGFEFRTTEIEAKSGFKAENSHLNPKGRVPILEMDGERITETPAILTTISALVPERELLGSTILEQARAQEWMAWLCATLHGQAFACLFRPMRFVGDESVYDAVKDRGRECVQECFQYIEEKLEGIVHAVGETFTLVDAYLYVFFRWGNSMKLGMEEKYPNYTRLVEEVVKRNSVKKAVEAEDIDLLNG